MIVLIAVGFVLWALWPRDATAVVQGVGPDGVVAVELEGRSEHLRLAYVDLAGAEEQCLGREGVTALEQLLPVGTTVTLVHGTVHERDGAYVTGLLVGDMLIDEQLAATGLAAQVEPPGHTDLVKQVGAAHAEAAASQVGYFDPTITCTPAGLVDTYETLVGEFVEESGAAALSQDVAVIDDALTAHSAVAAAHTHLQGILWDGDDRSPAAVLGTAALADLRGRVNVGATRANAALAETETALRAAQAAEAARLAELERQAEVERQAEAARVEAARVEAERQAQAARQAEERRRSASSPKSSSGGSSSGGSSGSSGYTGCRAYAPGGKSWKPIPCP